MSLEQSADVPRPSRWRVHGRPSPALWFAIVVIVPVTSLLFRLRYRHGDRIPRQGPVLLVANHVSLLDPLACARMAWDNGRVPHFLAKQSLFRGWVGAILRSAAQISVARHSADAQEALAAARAALAAGAPVLASDLGAFRAVLRPDGAGRGGEVGVTFPTGDAGALAAALAALLDDPGRRAALRVAGRARAAEFDWPVVAAAELRVYRAAIAADPLRVPARSPAGSR